MPALIQRSLSVLTVGSAVKCFESISRCIKTQIPFRGLHLSAHVFWPLWPRCLSGSCTSAPQQTCDSGDAEITRQRWFIRRWFQREFFPMSQFLFGRGRGKWPWPTTERGERRGSVGSECFGLWVRGRSDSDASERDDGWGTRARVEEKELERGGRGGQNV